MDCYCGNAGETSLRDWRGYIGWLVVMNEWMRMRMRMIVCNDVMIMAWEQAWCDFDVFGDMGYFMEFCSSKLNFGFEYGYAELRLS